MTVNIEMALDRFVDSYIKLAQSKDGLQVEYDSEWQSPCINGSFDDGEQVLWQPVLQDQDLSFDDMANALEISIAPEFETFFTRYWSDHLEARTADGNLSLLQVWNQDDFERLQQNLIGHVLMKRRLKQADTLFFAVTDQEDYIVSLECETGHVVVERVGKRPHKTLANSIADFINQLQPAI